MSERRRCPQIMLCVAMLCGMIALGCSKSSNTPPMLSNQEIETLIASPSSNTAIENFIGELIIDFNLLEDDKYNIYKGADLHNLNDIARLNCLQSPDCHQKKQLDPSVIDNCVEATLTPLKTDLRNYPKCKNEILEFYKVSHTCTFIEHLTTCHEEIKDFEREYKLTASAQSVFDCMKVFLKDMNAKNSCIESIDTAGNQFDALLDAYCDIAKSCNAVSDISDCKKKYHNLFTGDKEKGVNCTELHKELMIYEFKFVKRAQNQSPSQDACEIISSYETSYRLEDLLAQSKTIKAYTDALTIEVQRAPEQQRLTKLRLLAKYGNKIEDQNFMSSYYMKEANYQACMIRKLSPN